jgi:hypothetical protein
MQQDTKLSPKEFKDEVKLIATKIAELLFNELYPARIGDHEFQLLDALSIITVNIMAQRDMLDVLPLFIAQLTQTVEAIEKGEAGFIRTRSDQ